MAAPDFPYPRASASGDSAIEPAASPSETRDPETEVAGSTLSDPCGGPAAFDHGEPAPQLWGHLQRLEKVGQGVFGEVFRAWDAQLEREVALKLARGAGCCHESAVAGGLREARLLARVRHPSVVTVYGADHFDGRFGIWMEFIRGRTLEALLRENGQLPARLVTKIGLDLCSAVAAVHRCGLLHRDIKTKNVMREDSGRIVLMDFGLSQDLRNPAGPRSAHEIRGTPAYMAPEILRGEKASARSDIYSIGVLLYRLATGCYPVEARSVDEIRQTHERGDATPLEMRRAGMSAPFVRAIELALSADPDSRFATVAQMSQALGASLTVY